MSEVNTDKGLGGLKDVRAFLGLSQGELAEKVGITSDFVARIEGGKQDCSLSLLRALASACACDPADLLSAPSARRLCCINVDYTDRQAHEARAAVALFTDTKAS